MLTVAVSVNPFFPFNSDDYLSFSFISSALNICILLGFFFFDKILKFKFNSNCPQEANNVVFAAILPMNFPVNFPNRDNSSTFFYICEIVCYPLFFFSPSYSPSSSYLLIYILTVTVFCTAVERVYLTLFLLLVMYFHPNLLDLLEISLHSRINQPHSLKAVQTQEIQWSVKMSNLNKYSSPKTYFCGLFFCF